MAPETSQYQWCTIVMSAGVEVDIISSKQLLHDRYMSLRAGIHQWREITAVSTSNISNIRINVNHGKEQFNDGTMAIFGSKMKGGSFQRAALKVWVNIRTIQK